MSSNPDYSRPGKCLLCGIRYYSPDIYDNGYCSQRCEEEDPEWQ